VYDYVKLEEFALAQKVVFENKELSDKTFFLLALALVIGSLGAITVPSTLILHVIYTRLIQWRYNWAQQKWLIVSEFLLFITHAAATAIAFFFYFSSSSRSQLEDQVELPRSMLFCINLAEFNNRYFSYSITLALIVVCYFLRVLEMCKLVRALGPWI